MNKYPALLFAAMVALPVSAEETRQLDSHEHGVGELNIAFDGSEVAIELHAPGADIVGFEYEAESAKDRAAIDEAVAILARPLDLFGLPEDAACSVVRAAAELESEDAHHDDHDDDHAGHKDHDHDEHHADEKDHDDHDEHHAEEKSHDHDEHHEEAKGHDHDEHHDDDEHHADEAGHTEFHAEYLLNCAKPDALKQITFAYFDVFPNALELEVQVITDSGATAFEVERDAPKLDLSALF